MPQFCHASTEGASLKGRGRLQAAQSVVTPEMALQPVIAQLRKTERSEERYAALAIDPGEPEARKCLGKLGRGGPLLRPVGSNPR